MMKAKEHTLTDGSVWTSPMVAEALQCTLAVACTRLAKTKDPAVLLKPIQKRGTKKTQAELSIKEIRSNRMYFDPLGHWNLLNKNT